MAGWRLALLLLAGAAYAGVSHWMMVFHADAPWAIVVLLGPLWLTGLGLAASRFGGWGLAAALAVGVALFGLVIAGQAGDPDRLYVLQHVGINAVLGAWFGGSLRGGGLSLIGQFAQRVHAVSPAMAAYTANVTRVWTAYFILTVVASLVVYATLPFAAWSALANLVSPALVVVLFVGEHLMRYRLHPEFERTRMIDALRAFYGSPADRPARR